jgi:hypothetical protein
MTSVSSRVLAASAPGRLQQRVIDTARRDAAERQIVVFDDGGDDVAAART